MHQGMVKAAIITVFATAIFTMGYEMFLRSKQYDISFDDSPALYANMRRKVYLPQEKATVVIGSSRTKFDISPEVWASVTKETLVQLSNVGSNPLYTLHELATDEQFKGKLIIDASENMLFNLSPRMSQRPRDMTQYYHDETPAQRMGFFINQILESRLLFLDKENFAFSAVLDKASLLPPRKGIMKFPPYPVEFGRVTAARQEYIGEGMRRDSSQLKQMQNVWVGISDKTSVFTPHQRDSLFQTIKMDIQKIKHRGGQVIFVRPPSSGPLLANEKKFYPRQENYNALLQYTSCKGIYFEDYDTMLHYNLPEYSHLCKEDADKYTKALIEAIRKDIGWKI